MSESTSIPAAFNFHTSPLTCCIWDNGIMSGMVSFEWGGCYLSEYYTSSLDSIESGHDMKKTNPHISLSLHQTCSSL